MNKIAYDTMSITDVILEMMTSMAPLSVLWYERSLNSYEQICPHSGQAVVVSPLLSFATDIWHPAGPVSVP